MLFFGPLFHLAIITSRAFGQVTGVGPYGCRTQAGISSLTACDQYSLTSASCFSDPSATAAIQSCHCRQDVLDKIFDCESEFRLCYLNDQFDYLADQEVSAWHSLCDGYITDQLTTPALSNPTTTFPTLVGDQPFCTEYLTSCAVLSSSISSCGDIDTIVTDLAFRQCACSTRLLSLASKCVYDYSRTCFSLNATLTDIALFSVCGSTYSNGDIIVMTTTTGLLPSTNTSTISASTGQSGSTTPMQTSAASISHISATTSTIHIAISSSQSPAATSTSTSAGSRPGSYHRWHLSIVFFALACGTTYL